MLLNIENYPNTEELMKAVHEQFSKGVEIVNMANDSEMVGSMLSPEATRKALARRIAEHWVNHPPALEELESSLEEEAEDWERKPNQPISFRTCWNH